jgi:hypothetical protein
MITMKFLSLFSLAALFATASAFTQHHVSFAPRTAMRSATKSSLNMVADDAKVCLVTGSSRGLGKSIALELGKHGQKVVINYVSDGSKDAAEATVQEIKDLGGDAIALQADSKFFISMTSWSLPAERAKSLVFLVFDCDFRK